MEDRAYPLVVQEKEGRVSFVLGKQCVSNASMLGIDAHAPVSIHITGETGMNIQMLSLGCAIALLTSSCAGPDKASAGTVESAPTSSQASTSSPDAHPLSGWYLQGAGGSRLQPCGQSVQWQIGDMADLQARAKAFGLQDDTPVYVKLLARVSTAGNNVAKKVDVVRVEQFGSPTPVRDCAMTGVVMPAPAS
jgi:hypothetical protein